jgi:hypothetical protein
MNSVNRIDVKRDLKIDPTILHVHVIMRIKSPIKRKWAIICKFSMEIGIIEIIFWIKVTVLDGIIWRSGVESNEQVAGLQNSRLQWISKRIAITYTSMILANHMWIMKVLFNIELKLTY